MPRFSAAGRGATNVPTTKRGPNIYAGASYPIRVVEIGVFNTTTTACAVAVMRATATGTKAGALVADQHDPSSPAATATIYTSQSADATIADLTKTIAQASLGAAVGAGMVWTFGAGGLVIPAGTGNGLVLTAPQGTGQYLDFYFVWDE